MTLKIEKLDIENWFWGLMSEPQDTMRDKILDLNEPYPMII